MTLLGSHVGTLSLAVPAYNEAGNLPRIIAHWVAYLRRCNDFQSFEIVVCNDGSRDQTGGVLKTLSAEYPELHPVEHVTNQGAGVALATAIRHTTGDWVLLLDADGQFPIENLEPMTHALRTVGGQAFLGARHKKQNNLFARCGSYASALLCNLFHGTWYQDFNSAFKLINGPMLRRLHLEVQGLNYSTEITSKWIEAGGTWTEVPIAHAPRGAGRSSLSLFRGACHRCLFVLYVGVRQLLITLKVLQRPVL